MGCAPDTINCVICSASPDLQCLGAQNAERRKVITAEEAARGEKYWKKLSGGEKEALEDLTRQRLSCQLCGRNGVRRKDRTKATQGYLHECSWCVLLEERCKSCTVENRRDIHKLELRATSEVESTASTATWVCCDASDCKDFRKPRVAQTNAPQKPRLSTILEEDPYRFDKFSITDTPQATTKNSPPTLTT